MFGKHYVGLVVVSDRSVVWRTWIMETIKFNRAISTGKLNASPRLHTQPINVVVFHGSQGVLVSRWVSRLDAFSGYPVHT